MKKVLFTITLVIFSLTSCTIEQEKIFFNKVEKTYYEKGEKNIVETTNVITVNGGDTTWDLANECGGNPYLYKKIRHMNPWLDAENRYFEKEILVNGILERRPFIIIFEGEELFVPADFSCSRINVIKENVSHEYYFPTDDPLYKKTSKENNSSTIGVSPEENVAKEKSNNSLVPFLLGNFLPGFLMVLLVLLLLALIYWLLNNRRNQSENCCEEILENQNTHHTETMTTLNQGFAEQERNSSVDANQILRGQQGLKNQLSNYYNLLKEKSVDTVESHMKAATEMVTAANAKEGKMLVNFESKGTKFNINTSSDTTNDLYSDAKEGVYENNSSELNFAEIAIEIIQEKSPSLEEIEKIVKEAVSSGKWSIENQITISNHILSGKNESEILARLKQVEKELKKKKNK